jgi:hypothetical protein
MSGLLLDRGRLGVQEVVHNDRSYSLPSTFLLDSGALPAVMRTSQMSAFVATPTNERLLLALGTARRERVDVTLPYGSRNSSLVPPLRST